MKPISLKIAGLHSFREPQTVDFERLCAAGLFGICGPTGSGKSTILDAITLALFGKVERAAHGTRGILNHAEDRVAVEFTFELNQPEGRKRYRVERVYRRTGEHTVASAGARLLEIGPGGEVPRAEKSDRVTAEIEALLGLTAEDFTRAVVLPQGKFDEFLKKIKPAERRQMLERLFSLAGYGEMLKQKVNRRLERVENELAALQGGLNELGDASDEALSRAQERLAEAGRRAGKAEERFRLADKDYREKEQIMAWQSELAEVERAGAVLKERRAEIERMQEKLAAAARAAQAVPYLREVDEAAKVQADARRKWEEVQVQLNAAARAAETARAALEKARVRRRQEEPALLEKKGQLARALTLEKESGALKKEADAHAKELQALEKEKEKAGSALGERRAKKAELERAVNSCRERLAEIQVEPGRRRQAAEALLALQQWQRAESESRRAQDGLQKKEKAAAEAENALAEALKQEQEARAKLEQAALAEKETRESRPDDEEGLQNSGRELERRRAQTGAVLYLLSGVQEARDFLKDREEELSKAQETARRTGALLAEAARARDETRQRVEALEEKLNELHRRNLAYRLARTLKQGEPCPVCGSIHHPAPAVTDEADHLQDVERELAQAREGAAAAQREMEKIQREEAAAAAGVNAAFFALTGAQKRLAALERELAAARGELLAAWAELTPEQLKEELAREEDRLERRKNEWQAWQKKLEEQRQALQAAREDYNRAALALAAAEEKRKSAWEAVQEAAARAQEAAAEAQKRLAELDAARGSIPVDRIAAEQKEIERLDAQRAGLEKERDELEKELTAVNPVIEDLMDREGKLAAVISGTREKLNGLRAQLIQKEDELKKITGGQPAGRMLAEVEARLQELAETEQKAQAEEERFILEKNGLEQAFAAAQKALDLAQERLLRAQAKLAGCLQELRFVTRREAEEAVLSSAEIQELQNTVEEYRREKERLAGLHRSLTEKLAGRRLSPLEWQKCREELEAARREQEEALLAKNVAAFEAERLSQANARWKELKRQAGETGALKNRLEILKELLRGNAFVDYLAEEQLVSVARDASVRLGELTRHRYALEIDSEGGFVVRDEANGGVKRPVSTLSGGETFVASLALALALSTQIQLKGRYPLEFFFLDEGFGALDPELLEVVVSTLEKLRLAHLNIGVISHVPELQNRLPRRLIVHPAQAAGAGSRLVLEVS